MSGCVVPADRATRVRDVGGKAATLARLAALGFDVPPFVVVRAGAEASPRELLDAAATLGDGPLAVRSSAVEEDGAAHSHAGQFLSVLNVDRDGLAEAVARVGASGRSETLQAYRQGRGLDGGVKNGVETSAIVQRQIAPRASGVMFTADPLSGRGDRVVIAAVAGLGDALAAGEVEGASYAIDRASGRIVERPAEDGPLSENDLRALSDLAGRVETACGAPQDIEWAFEEDRLFLLQARPITTPLRPAPVEDAATVILDNSNIVESYPGVVSPLTFSFASYAYARVYRGFLTLVGCDERTIRRSNAALETMLSRHQGRVFYNLISWYRLLALLPGFRLNRGYMETMMGVGEPLPAEIADALAPAPARGFSRIGEYGRIARMLGRLAWSELRIRRTIARFESRVASALATGADMIDGLPLSALTVEYRRLEAELLDDWDAPLINDFLCMIAYGASRKLMERWAREEGLALHNDVLIGQGAILSAEPPRRIAEMAEAARGDAAAVAALSAGDLSGLSHRPDLLAAIDAYLERFGERCVEELKLESATLHEDPGPLLAAIAAAAERPAKERRAPAEPGDRIGALFASRPVRRFFARRLLAWSKARVRDRENLRFLRTRIFGRVRRLFQAMGAQLHARGRLDDPRDVFLLTVGEVLSAVEGTEAGLDLASIAGRRRVEQARFAELPDPPERLTLRPGSEEAVGRAPKADAGEAIRSGTGCSAGRVVGRARVVRDARKATLEPGEILVASHTDPGWIALFANAGGIVVERGSLLSHSAIVARELGIPCVVGLRGACDWLSTGDLIEIDGASGAVRRTDA